MITMAAILSITATTQPTTMPVIQPAEHPTDCAGLTFTSTVVSGLLCMVLESGVSISVVPDVVVNTVN